MRRLTAAGTGTTLARSYGDDDWTWVMNVNVLGRWRISSKRNQRLRLDQVPWTVGD